MSTGVRDTFGDTSGVQRPQILHAAVREAVRLDWIARDPLTVVRRPAIRRRPFPAWTDDEWAAVWAAIVDEPRAVAVWLAVATGFRQGEVLALRWADYHAAARTVTVARALKALPGPAVFGPPKTEAGARTVAIDAGTVRRLAAHRAAQNRQRLTAGEAWQDHDLIVARPDGRPEKGATLSSWWTDRQVAAGVPHLRWHDLRHLHATVLLGEGTALPEVAQRLGHASPAITLAIYGHVLAEADRAAAHVADRYFDAGRDTSGDTAPS